MPAKFARDQERAAGDAGTFIVLYDTYFKRIYNYIRYRVNDPHTADDLTAHVFETLLTHFEQYDPEQGPFEPPRLKGPLLGVILLKMGQQGFEDVGCQVVSRVRVVDAVTDVVVNPLEIRVVEDDESPGVPGCSFLISGKFSRHGVFIYLTVL